MRTTSNFFHERNKIYCIKTGKYTLVVYNANASKATAATRTDIANYLHGFTWSDEVKLNVVFFFCAIYKAMAATHISTKKIQQKSITNLIYHCKSESNGVFLSSVQACKGCAIQPCLCKGEKGDVVSDSEWLGLFIFSVFFFYCMSNAVQPCFNLLFRL